MLRRSERSLWRRQWTPRPPAADLSGCNVCVWRWVTALSGPYWWNGSGSCAVSPPQISCRLIRFHNVSVKVINTLPVHEEGVGDTMLGSIDFSTPHPPSFFLPSRLDRPHRPCSSCPLLCICVVRLPALHTQMFPNQANTWGDQQPVVLYLNPHHRHDVMRTSHWPLAGCWSANTPDMKNYSMLVLRLKCTALFILLLFLHSPIDPES